MIVRHWFRHGLAHLPSLGQIWIRPWHRLTPCPRRGPGASRRHRPYSHLHAPDPGSGLALRAGTKPWSVGRKPGGVDRRRPSVVLAPWRGHATVQGDENQVGETRDPILGVESARWRGDLHDGFSIRGQTSPKRAYSVRSSRRPARRFPVRFEASTTGSGKCSTVSGRFDRERGSDVVHP